MSKKLKHNKSARNKIVKMVLDTYKILDPTGIVSSFYKDYFNSLDDNGFYEFMLSLKNGEVLIVPSEQGKNEIKLENIEKALNYIGHSMEEYIYYKHFDPDSEPTRSPEKCLVLMITEKRVQQHLSKKNGISTSYSERSPMTSTVTGHDRNGILSDVEISSLQAYNSKAMIKELTSFRADNMNMKEIALQNISRDGYLYMKDLPDRIQDKEALNTLNTYFTAAGIKTDLVNKDLALTRTLEGKKVKRIKT